MTRYQDIAQLLDANAITNVVDAYENAYEKGRADAIAYLEKRLWECGMSKDKFVNEISNLYMKNYVMTLHDIIDELKEQKNESNNIRDGEMACRTR